MHVHVYLKSFLARRRRLSLSAASSSCTLPKHTCITLLPQPPAAAASPSPALQAAPAPPPPPPLRAYAHAQPVGAPCRPRANPPLSPRRRPRSWLRRPRPVPPSPLLLLPGGGGLGRLRSLPLPPLRLLPRCKLLPLRLRLLLCALTLVQTSHVTGDWAGKARTKHRRESEPTHLAPARCARPRAARRRKKNIIDLENGKSLRLPRGLAGRPAGGRYRESPAAGPPRGALPGASLSLV